METHGLLATLPRRSRSLLMRIGNLTIAEWSHNGSLRIWHAGNADAPELYQADYSAWELREGSDWDKRHLGNWMAEAIEQVHRLTGVRRTPFDR